mmetsp:Transcript_40686/g.132227  ORF Transcript_40686/g.132227 Transcript_40686/m.132227 type:complete len:200 (+) Transcript_40686:62-661(+)
MVGRWANFRCARGTLTAVARQRPRADEWYSMRWRAVPPGRSREPCLGQRSLLLCPGSVLLFLALGRRVRLWPGLVEALVDEVLDRLIDERHQRYERKADQRGQPARDHAAGHELWEALCQGVCRVDNLVDDDRGHEHRRNRLEGERVDAGPQHRHRRRALRLLLAGVVHDIDADVGPRDAIRQTDDRGRHHWPHRLADV